MFVLGSHYRGSDLFLFVPPQTATVSVALMSRLQTFRVSLKKLKWEGLGRGRKTGFGVFETLGAR